MARWTRFIPAISFSHVIMIFLAMAMVAWSIVLGGCSSSTAGMVNVYVLSVSYNAPVTTIEAANQPSYLTALANLTQKASLEVRGAFFGLCVRVPSLLPGQSFWDCAKPDEAVARYGEDVDPLRLVEYVATFVKRIEFYGLILGSQILMLAAFCGLASFPGWHTEVTEEGSEHEVRPFPSRHTTTLIAWSLAWAIGFGLVSILWLHVGAVAAAESLQANFRHLVRTKLGAAIMSLGWVAVAFTMVAMLAMIIMVMSIQLLSKLTDDDED